MKKIQISSDIKGKVEKLRLGYISAKCIFNKNNSHLWTEIDREIIRISEIPLDIVKNIPQIKSSREAYKSFGKEPARYRLSSEALHRRIINGKGLFKISNIVDVINLSSLRTGYSIGGYDSSKIMGDITFDIGRKDEVYEAIGRGIINIENLPVFRDTLGAFGSPTSDSTRTMINEETKDVLLIVINFGGHQDFDTDLRMIEQLLKDYCSAESTDVKIFL